MNQESDKMTAPAAEPPKPAPIWGQIVIDILKKLLEYNQLTSGIKKKF